MEALAMHIVIVNYGWHVALNDPSELLDRYETLTGWAEALSAAGARVTVVQRFGRDCSLERNGITYRFVRACTPRQAGVLDWPLRIHRVVAECRPDVVHVNGLLFARQAWMLQRMLGSEPILVQDHANPPHTGLRARLGMKSALRRMDAVSFTALEQAEAWHESGLLDRNARLFELLEGSSSFRLTPRSAARAQTQLAGNPACLWVGRLDANKDPSTVLRGFARALPQLPDAHLTMIFDTVDLLPEIQKWLRESGPAGSHVTLKGPVPHKELEAIYNSADIFLLGSHHEGSGYALLEAISCGVVPVVTDIPSFRKITGNAAIGGLWPVENVDALAWMLLDAWERYDVGTPERIRSFFDERLSFGATAHQALAAYRQLCTGEMERVPA